jgi:hypothetical protein
MNIDNLPELARIRKQRFTKNLSMPDCKRWYTDSCRNIRKYSNEQAAVYDPTSGQIKYGLSTNTHAAGVSDGTCDQMNMYLKLKSQQCGLGAAGGNRCVPDAYGVEPFDNILSGYNSCNTISIIAIIIVVIILFIIFSRKTN